ncbi:serine/threonine-protein kinase [Arthrobacter sp. TMP15]|uniref:serine/threonine-protein kinase n=1 Tax=Arthrobacter sp. TMP15 TaxID=3140789 RepID=UPI0031BAE989
MNLSELPTGTTINDRYELVGILGAGAGGSVYEAHDRHLSKRVAVKLLNPQDENPGGSWKEAQLLEHLKSRFLLNVINADVVIDSDIRFIVTPVMSGGDLQGFSEPFGLSASTAARLVQQIASGLDRIHRADMVHRDVKPANVLLGGNEAVLGDLGFCHLLDVDGTAPPNGTYCTVAPEVLDENGKCSPLTDIYSLAATAFYFLSGEYPIDHRDTKLEQRDQIMAGSFRELRTIAPHVSRSVGAVIRKSLNRDPQKRHPSATEFGNSLAGAVQGIRDWNRVNHAEHVYCISGASHGSKKEIQVCCQQVDSGPIEVRARMAASGRQVSGKPDFLVAPGKLPVKLQQLTASL